MTMPPDDAGGLPTLTPGRRRFQFGEYGVVLRLNPSCQNVLAARLQRLAADRERTMRRLDSERRKFVHTQWKKHHRLAADSATMTTVSELHHHRALTSLSLPEMTSQSARSTRTNGDWSDGHVEPPHSARFSRQFGVELLDVQRQLSTMSSSRRRIGVVEPPTAAEAVIDVTPQSPDSPSGRTTVPANRSAASVQHQSALTDTDTDKKIVRSDNGIGIGTRLTSSPMTSSLSSSPLPRRQQLVVDPRFVLLVESLHRRRSSSSDSVAWRQHKQTESERNGGRSESSGGQQSATGGRFSGLSQRRRDLLDVSEIG